MKAAISGRGLISHVTGVPTPPARTDQAFERWKQADHCVFTWLLQNVEQKLVSRLTQYPTAKDIWTSLEVMYASGGDKIQVYDMYAKAITFKQKEESLEEIWTTLNDLWISIDRRQPNRMKYAEDIEIYNTEKQEQRLFQLLVALNSKYETIKKEILRADPLPSVENAYSILRREDARSAILQTGDSGAQGIGAGLVVTQLWQNPAAHRNPPNEAAAVVAEIGADDRTKKSRSRCALTVERKSTHATHALNFTGTRSGGKRGKPRTICRRRRSGEVGQLRLWPEEKEHL